MKGSVLMLVRFSLRLSLVVLITSPVFVSATAKPPAYREHQQPAYYLDAKGEKHPVKTIADWKIRRGPILDGMQSAMGRLPGKEKRVPLDVRVIEEEQVGALIRRKITYRTEPEDRVAAFLFLPPDEGERCPAVLCLQQTNRKGKLEAAGIDGDPNLAYALHLARRGYVTLAPDYPGFGESRYDFDPRWGYASGSMKAVWDNIRSVDLLQSLSRVDPQRIGCIGHSLGGHNAMFTAAFDQRIRVIVSNCGFCRFHKDDVPSWTGERYMPRISSIYENDPDRVPFDFPEIVAAFAPRPFLAIAAKRDRDFDYTGVQESIAAAKPIYRLYGKADNLEALYPDTPHAFLPPARKVAYEFLDKHLRSTRSR